MANTVGPGGTSGGGGSDGGGTSSGGGGTSSGGDGSAGSDYDNAEGSGGMTDVGIPAKLVGKGGGGGAFLKTSALPDWVKSLQPLAAIAGVLVAFAEDPIGFIRSYLAQIAAGWAADIVDSFIAAILDVASVLGGIVGDAGDVVVDGLLVPVATSGGLLISTHETLVSAVQSLGPLAPAGIIVLYAAELVVGFAVIDGVLSVGVFGLGQSIPIVGGAFAAAGAFYEWLKQLVGSALGVVR